MLKKLIKKISFITLCLVGLTTHAAVFKPIILTLLNPPALPAQVETNTEYTFNYQLQNPNNIPQSYLLTLNNNASQIDFNKVSCVQNKPTILAANGSCNFTVVFSAGTVAENYLQTIATLQTVGFPITTLIFKTQVVSDEPPPPSSIPVTVTINGDITEVNPTQQITVTLEGAGENYGPHLILANGTSQAFEDMPAGTYTVTAPSSVTANNVLYLLESAPTTFTVSSTSTNLSLTYNAYTPPPAPVPVSVVIAGDLQQNSPATEVAVTLSNSHNTYGPNDILADGTAHSFGSALAGTYTVAPTSLTGADGKTYVLENNSAVVPSAGGTITLSYDEATPVTGTQIKITGDLVSDHSGTPINITLQNFEMPTFKGSASIVADGAAHALGETLTAGSYYIYPFEVTVNNTTYALKNIYPQSVLSANSTVTAEYDALTAGSGYDWHQNHLAQLKAANMFAVLWGGGSTTGPVHISSNPIINPFLNAQIANYENNPTSLSSSAKLNDMPNYIAMGAVSEADGQGLATAQLQEQNLDITFHYEGSDGGGDQHCYADVNAQNPNPSNCYSAVNGYTPEITKMVAQANAVTAATGHETVAGEVFYSINMSGGSYNGMIDMGGMNQGSYDDEALEAHIYNLALEAILMQQAEAAGHPTILFLNPDFPAFYQECAEYYCPVQWKAGLSSSTPTFMTQLNLQADFNAAMDRLVVFDRLTTVQSSALKSAFSKAIPTQTTETYSVPYIVEMYNFIMKSLAPSVPFGWGLNLYDNANPTMNEGSLQNVTLNWQYGGAYWLYRVNNAAYLKGSNGATYTKAEAIQYSADKLATFLNAVNISASSAYAPDFIYFDIYERDPIPNYVSCATLSARVYNGANLDDYLTYIADTDAQVGNLPVALWQMPGSSLQSTSDPYSGNYAGTIPDWTFGHPSLNNDMSNLSSTLQTIFGTITWNNSTNETCYVTSATSLSNYLTLTSI